MDNIDTFKIHSCTKVHFFNPYILNLNWRYQFYFFKYFQPKMIDICRIAKKNSFFLNYLLQNNLVSLPIWNLNRVKIYRYIWSKFFNNILVKNQRISDISRKSIAIDQIWFLIFCTNFEIIIRVPPWILFKKYKKIRFHKANLIFM